MKVLVRTPRSRSRTPLQWIEGVLLALGVICFCWFGYNWIASQTDQIWSNYSLDARLNGEDPSVGGLWRYVIHGQTSHNGREKPVGDVATFGTPSPRMTRKRVPSGEDIGRIEIPRLRISAMVRQGVDDKVLSRAVGHVPSTALPGEAGNVGLAAHRDSYFRNLRDVKEGDSIRMVTADGTWEYAVESLRIVHPSDVEVLDPTPHPSITLVTCYPFNFVGHAPQRFIVRAKLLDQNIEPPREASVSQPLTKRVKRRRS